MSAFYNYSTIIITLAALLSYINHRFIRLPPSIAIMGFTLIFSIILLIFTRFGLDMPYTKIRNLIDVLHFRELVINVMLGLLLFAGALTIDLTDLRKQKIEIASLSIVSTIASAFIIAGFAYFILNFLGVSIQFVYCMLFGSLISPTDPIAVLTIFKKLGAPRDLTTIISAESLFNDGVGVVLFLTTLTIAFSNIHPTTLSVIGLFLREALGGIIYGIILGWLGYHLVKSINDSRVEILLTIAMATGGYTLARSLMVSAPLAMVVTGIFLANYRRHQNNSIRHRLELNHFWELLDELLNTFLFLLLGFELLAINFTIPTLIVSACMILVVLIARYLTVALPMAFIKIRRQPIPYVTPILTWGGLRGGLSVALALSIPSGDVGDALLTFTYVVVAFSILVQGTTIKYLIKRKGLLG